MFEQSLSSSNLSTSDDLVNYVGLQEGEGMLKLDQKSTWTLEQREKDQREKGDDRSA